MHGAEGGERQGEQGGAEDEGAEMGSGFHVINIAAFRGHGMRNAGVVVICASRGHARAMSAGPSIDTAKSLAELTGVDWGVAPAAVGTVVRERHEMHRTPVRDLPHTAIVRFLHIGCD